MGDTESFCIGFVVAAILSLILVIFLTAKPYTVISQEIVRNIQQSTNIVEALKKENLTIRKVRSSSEADTVEIIVEYDFLYKNSMKK